MALSLLCCTAGRPKGGGSSSAPRHVTDFIPATFAAKIGTTFGNPDQSADTGKIEKEDGKTRAAKLDCLAETLTRTIRKYPKSSKSFMRAPKERFMAVMPENNMNGLERWQHGYLAYWETREGLSKRTTPKGYISLMRIAKVQHLSNEHDGCGVIIKHKPDQNFQEMTILLPSKSEAGEFSYALWEFICKLRGQWGEKNPESKDRA